MDTTISNLETLLSHGPFLRSIARALVRDPHEAEDILQETWAVALRRRPEKRESLRFWLARVARNIVKDRRRAAESRLRREAARSVNFNEAAVPSADEMYERELLRRRIAQALFAVAEPWRTALLLRFYEGMEPAAIARMQQIPLDTVRSRVKRGLELLKMKLDEQSIQKSDWRGLLLPFAAEPVTATVSLYSAKTTAAAVAAAALLLVSAAVSIFYLNHPSNPEPADGRSLAFTSGADSNKNAVEEPASTASAPAAPLRESAPPTDRGILVIEAIYSSDGTPASNVGIQLLPWNQDPRFDAEYLLTNEKGIARREKLQPGKFGAYGDRGGNVQFKIEAGAEQKVTLMIPPGTTVDGIVTSPEGKPVPNADIWLSGYGNYTEGRVAAKSDSDGRYLLKGITDGHHVSARAAGFAPTYQFQVAGGGGRDTIHLQFTEREARIDGIVKDTEGRPIAGARVRIGPEAPIRFQNSNNKPAAGAPPRVLTTHSDGTFSAESVEPGSVLLQVRADGYSPRREVVDTEEGSARRVEMILTGGFEVFGVVTNSDGKPVAGAVVEASANTDGRDNAYFTYHATADARGMYIFKSLPNEKMLIDARRESFSEEGALAIVSAAPGSRIEQNLQLATAADIVGIVKSADGSPIAGCTVYVRPHFGTRRSVTMPPARDIINTFTTNSEGRFRVEGCAPATYILYVTTRPSAPMSLAASVSPVVPGAPEFTITIRDLAERNAKITGRFLRSDGSPVAEGDIYTYGANPLPLTKVRADGTFTSSPAPPGKYHIRAKLKGEAKWSSEVELEANKTLDLGTITLPAAGALEIDASAIATKNKISFLHDFTINPTGDLLTYPESGSSADDVEPDVAILRIPKIAAGKYILRPTAACELAYFTIPFEIESGKTTKLQIPKRPGVRRVFKFISADPAAPKADMVEATIEGASGTAPLRATISPDQANSHLQWSISLPVGKYKITAVASDGRRGEATTRIVREDESFTYVDVELR